MSKLSDLLADAQEKLDKIRRDRRFKKARLNMDDIVALRSALVTCSGQLAICKNDFELTIRDQARNIREGESIGADTSIQGEILENSAIGYMLVKDAIYELKSVQRSDTVTQAYNTLDVAIDLMTDRTRKLPVPGRIRRLKEREVFGGVTSENAVAQKRLIVSQIFEALKETGDIEACLKNAANPSAVRADRISGEKPSVSVDAVNETLYGGMSGSGEAQPSVDLSDFRD